MFKCPLWLFKYARVRSAKANFGMHHQSLLPNCWTDVFQVRCFSTVSRRIAVLLIFFYLYKDIQLITRLFNFFQKMQLKNKSPRKMHVVFHLFWSCFVIARTILNKMNFKLFAVFIVIVCVAVGPSVEATSSEEPSELEIFGRHLTI